MAKDASGNKVEWKTNNAIANIFHEIGQYFLAILKAILGYEGFADSSQINKEAIASVGFIILLGMLFAIANAFGAAYQSYCYNIYIGNTSGVAVVYSILCFFFPHFYYPFYALFLNPLCLMKPKNKGFLGLLGGRR